MRWANMALVETHANTTFLKIPSVCMRKNGKSLLTSSNDAQRNWKLLSSSPSTWTFSKVRRPLADLTPLSRLPSKSTSENALVTAMQSAVLAHEISLTFSPNWVQTYQSNALKDLQKETIWLEKTWGKGFSHPSLQWGSPNFRDQQSWKRSHCSRANLQINIEKI